MQEKRTSYRGWLIIWNDSYQLYELYTPEEMEQPVGFRYPEWETESIGDAKFFIDNY